MSEKVADTSEAFLFVASMRLWKTPWECFVQELGKTRPIFVCWKLEVRAISTGQELQADSQKLVQLRLAGEQRSSGNDFSKDTGGRPDIDLGRVMGIAETVLRRAVVPGDDSLSVPDVRVRHVITGKAEIGETKLPFGVNQ